MNNTMQKIDQNLYMNLTMAQWRDILVQEVNVYVYGNSYLAKRFDSIAYEFCSLKEAREILEDNLYALLKYKYFLVLNDEIDRLITKIVSTFTENLKTTLIKATFEWEGQTENKIIKNLPTSAVAFRNGAFDFKTNKWLFKVLKTPLQNIQNVTYEYNNDYAILWYLDIDFEPLEIDVTKIEAQELNTLLFDTRTELDNLCYSLVHNMSFNEHNKFSIQKFEHLCEVLGFTLSNQFIQNFIIFIGTGSNGKNSLLDGCFSSHVYPRPTSISLDTIEEDKFVTGSLENKYHNFFLESKGKTYYKTEVLKQLTGSTQVSIEKKGENKRTGFLNVKHIFSGNDRDKIKFGDSTNGFLRRINLFEVFYQWDSRGDYLKIGEYLNVNLSPDLKELKQNVINTITYIYLGMYGAARATKNFTKPFYFTHNDYNTKYENINVELKKQLNAFTLDDIIKMIISEDSEGYFYINDKRMYLEKSFKKRFSYLKGESWKECVNDEEQFIDYLDGKDIYINLNALREYLKSNLSTTSFNQEILKITKSLPKMYFNNQKYIPIQMIGRRVKFTK